MKKDNLMKRFLHWTDNKLYPLLDDIPSRIRKVIKTTKLGSDEYENIPVSSYLYGPSHTGKTVKAYTLLIEWHCLRFMECKRLDYVFINTFDLLEDLRSMYGSDNSLNTYIHDLKNTSLLVLDDIGVEKVTEWAYQVLYSIIDYRYNHEITTIYTSNLSIGDLSKKMNDDRIPNRIAKHCKNNIIKFTNKPY